MVLQAIGRRGKGVDKVFFIKELREYAENVYVTPSGPCFGSRPAVLFPLFAR
jgi:hypothetical protein